MTVLTEGARNYEFLINPATGYRSFESVTFATTAPASAGAVLGRVTAGAVTTAAQSGNTGNATVGTVTRGVNVKPGVYNVEFISATEFLLLDPAGLVVGNGQTGSAFSDGAHLSFTITAGATPMVAGDGFTLTVAAGSGNYVTYNASGTDGSATIVGILCENKPSSYSGPATVILRSAEVKKNKLVYTGTESTVLAALTALGIIARART